MNRTLEYFLVTVIALTFTYIVVVPIAEATSQSIIKSAHCISAPAECADQ